MTSIFTTELADYTLTQLNEELDKYCKQGESKYYFENLADQIFLQLDFPEVVIKLKLRKFLKYKIYILF